MMEDFEENDWPPLNLSHDSRLKKNSKAIGK